MTTLAHNVTLIVLARLAILAGGCALPIAGWIALRAIDTIDRISSKVDVIHDQVTIIQAQQTSQATILADDETRTRLLEQRRHRR
ncbi:hypothetical protein [Bradyrhizobium sp. SZCCHNR1098]|uniref:hypothetical protein n=1 Tax=Bradyrhizobium sp. SZCCHNR1098 TaxID=3057370 RepID=UPI002916D1BF|nr:hypothetical protein [Bradyrhizobium sp. SZCCHNR1098]